MQLNGEISYNKQYNENIKDTSNWLDTTDTALSQMGNIFGRIETLLVNAGNGAYYSYFYSYFLSNLNLKYYLLFLMT
ncbi:Flagellar hook-associated protein 3, partial [human gut metagenome]